MSLYTDTGVVARHRQELAALSVGKSCIRFRRIEDLAQEAIRQMLEESVGSRLGEASWITHYSAHEGDAWMRDKELVRRYEAGERSFSQTEVRGFLVWRARLARANLSRADLNGSSLRRARMARADLSGAHLVGTDLSKADLSRANLSGASMIGATLRGSRLAGSDLSGADLLGADLRRANLREANLQRADLRQAKLKGANLERADLTQAEVSTRQLDVAASIKGATLPDGTKSE